MSSQPTSIETDKSILLAFLAYLPVLLYTHTIFSPSSPSPSTSTLLAPCLKLLFYSAILLAISVINRCLTPPHTPPSSDEKSPENKKVKEVERVKDSISLFTQPSFLSLAKGIITTIAIYHGILSLLLNSSRPNAEKSPLLKTALQKICPNHTRLNPSLFTFSPLSTTLLTITIASALLRILAFRQLGRNFTFQLHTPSKLVTDGLYRYMRHPSYTFLIAVFVGFAALTARRDGGVACWVELERGVWWAMVGLGLVVGGWGTFVRVREEEGVLEREFRGKGKGWEEWVGRTGRFVPWVF